MSKNRFSLEYECKCEESYGTICGKKSIFVWVQFCSSDSNTIYHKYHEKPFEPYTLGEHISDIELYALTDLLNKNEKAGVVEGTPESYYKQEGTK